MKQLKTILGVIYPILIVLLLLSNCRGCKHSDNSQRSIEEPVDTARIGGEPADTARIGGEPADSASVVEQAQNTGQSGNLKITLLWNFQGDIDLHVTQPNGKTIYYKESKDASTGGFLDVDNRNGGNGSAENIFWENPPKGNYNVKLVYYKESQTTGIAESGTCSVVVFQQGKSPQTYQVEMNNVDETKNVVTINIQ